MTLLGSGALVAGGVVLLYVGAEGLVRGSAALALRMGISPLMVGLTIVAMGTSSPELVVCLEAALKGNGDIAVGSVIGSNISNLALILGVAAVIRPLATRRHLIVNDMAIVVVCSVLLVALLLDGSLSRIEGLVLTVGLVAYLALNVVWAKRGAPARRAADPRVPTERRWFALRDGLMLLGGLGVLVLGADTLLRGAVETADLLGLADAVVGLTIVAVGTSLPELATSMVAAIKREGDIAVGNVVGSNVLNILGILGPSAIISPLRSAGVDLVDLGAMLGITLLATLFMETRARLGRWEGCLLLGAYSVYVAFLLS